MKFGHRLSESVYGPFANYYLKYREIKTEIKKITGKFDSPILLSVSQYPSGTAESLFANLLDGEIDRIDQFSEIEYAALEEELRQINYEIENKRMRKEELSDKIDSIETELISFDEYLRINFTGFRKIIKKFDKLNNSKSFPFFISKILKSKFSQINLNKIMFSFNSIFSNLVPSPRATLPPLDIIHDKPNSYKRVKYFGPVSDVIPVLIELIK
jgi:SPX domain protein involved in polyphosphate accumulation